jgi:2-C-methyl-D-erythritol 4-phosphate cytidylyltransferase
MKNIALILASGTGSRCGLGYPKQFASINGKTIIEHTIDKFQTHKKIDEIILVTSKEYVQKLKDIVSNSNYTKVTNVIAGGETRKDSSYNGISCIQSEECNVLIHDGVRPLVTSEMISRCISELEYRNAVCVGIDTTDTIFMLNDNNCIQSIPERRKLKRAQTPQCFKLSLIRKAHQLANEDKTCKVTDDCGLIMHYNLDDIYIIDGDIDNIKVTYPEDLTFVENYLK